MWKNMNGQTVPYIMLREYGFIYMRTCEGHHNVDWTIDQMQEMKNKKEHPHTNSRTV